MKRRVLLKNVGYFGALSAVITPGMGISLLEGQKSLQETPQPVQDAKFTPALGTANEKTGLGSLKLNGIPVFYFKTWKLKLDKPVIRNVVTGEIDPVPKRYLSARIGGRGWIQDPGIPANDWIGSLLVAQIINPVTGAVYQANGYLTYIDALDYPSDYCDVMFEVSGGLNRII